MKDSKIQAYDEAGNLKALALLPSRLRVVFALLCASRLLPAYEQFHSRSGRGNPQSLNAMADKLWADCCDATMSDNEVKANLESCLHLIPEEDEAWDEETQPYAEDAATALAYAYRTRLDGNTQEAAWAARRIYESFDHFIQKAFGVSAYNSDTEQKILSHPLVQAELTRQRRDLFRLENLVGSENVAEAIQALREQSELESKQIQSDRTKVPALCGAVR